MLNRTAATAIGLYQRHLSPLKGFRCAYRCHTGRRSCSEYARRMALRRGVLALLRALPRQFARCRAAYAALAQETPEARRRRENAQRRDKRSSICDGCDPCCCPLDAGRCDGPGDCAPCSCDLSP